MKRVRVGGKPRYNGEMIGTKVTPPKRWWRRRPSTERGHRIYAIGDLHGRFDLFEQMIQRLETDNAERGDDKRVTLVVLGDVIDRGPASRRLVHLLMSSQRQGGRLTVLMGNHEGALLDCIAGDAEAQAGWLRFGGLATLESFGIDPPGEGESADAFGQRLVDGLTPAVVEWLAALPLSIRCGDYFFCHAGVRPGVPLRRQSPDDLLWIREPFLSTSADLGAVVVHGHTVVDGVRLDRNRISIDTGAYETGVLSAVCLDGTDAWVFATAPDQWSQEAGAGSIR